MLHNHQDCGLLVFDRTTQDVQAGGSRGGVLGQRAMLPCAAQAGGRQTAARAVPLYRRTDEPDHILQGESIPGVAHLVELRCAKEETE